MAKNWQQTEKQLKIQIIKKIRKKYTKFKKIKKKKIMEKCQNKLQ